VLEDATGGPAGLRLNVETAKIPSGKRVTDYKYWEYESPDAGRVDIDFSPTTQRVVRVFCYATDNHECPSLLRISGGMSEDQVLNTLGAPSQAELSTENILPLSAVKVLSYAKFKIAFYLEQRRVYGLELGARQQQPATRVPE
jgi:hypothetical protein